MDRQRLDQLYDRYETRANNAFQNYQETGTPRYLNDWRNYDELTEIITMALNAVDEHNKLIALEGALNNLAHRSEMGEDVSSDLLKLCIGQKIYRKTSYD